MTTIADQTKTQVTHRQPAEWGPHRAVWTGWPYLENEWPYITESQKEFINFCWVIANLGNEELNIAFPSEEIHQKASKRLGDISYVPHIMPYGDSWFRDTAPVFIWKDGKPASLCFNFNGWGGKYQMPGDEEVARILAQKVGFPTIHVPMIFEGGSMDVDGLGTGLTTKQCLLNPNRNPDYSRDEIERMIMDAYGLEKLIWFDEGLMNDHTDGHIDNLVRFVAPGKVVAMYARDNNDPNRETYERVIHQLQSETDALGRPLEIIKIPSPGKVVIDGDVVPASYMNFVITNGAVIVPTFGSPYDQEAVKAIATCFPGRHTGGISSKYILTGGGSFHCMTQQEPAF